MDNLSLLANLPNHVNGKHLNVYRWLDGCGWSIDVDGHHFENHSFNLLVHEVLEYFSCYERSNERSGYGLKGSMKKLYEDNIKGKYYIPFVLEDNCKCVEMWRNEGLICLQPNEGKF